MATLHIMSREGDTQHDYNQETGVGVLEAHEAFKEAKGRGFLAYMLDEHNNGKVIHEFDETAPKIVMTPILAGG